MNKLKRYLLFLVGLFIKSYLFPDVLYSEIMKAEVVAHNEF